MLARQEPKTRNWYDAGVEMSAATPPTETTPKYEDFVLVQTPYHEHNDHSSRPVKLFEDAYDLGQELRIGRLESDLAEAVFDACLPAGENFKPIRQVGCAYAIWRTPDTGPAAHGIQFDPDSRLHHCVALSRLVQPTSVGFEYAARIE